MFLHQSPLDESHCPPTTTLRLYRTITPERAKTSGLASLLLYEPIDDYQPEDLNAAMLFRILLSSTDRFVIFLQQVP